jgi:hypothetical protein
MGKMYPPSIDPEIGIKTVSNKKKDIWQKTGL